MPRIFRPPIGSWRTCAGALLLAVSLAALSRLPAAEPSVALDAEPAPLAENVGLRHTVGKIRFNGMLVIPSRTIEGFQLSQLSDIAWDEDAGVLYAISDKGVLFHLQPTIRDGVLVDLALARAVPLRELETGEPLRDRRADAEGLDILHGDNGRANDAELIISFERYPRVLRYRPDGRALGEYSLPAILADREAYSHPNRMLEAVCREPRLGILAMPEKPLRKEAPGQNRLYSLSGESWRYPIDDQNRVVGLSCLGNGEVLVLEGNFGTRFWRSHTTLKRVRLPDGAPADTLRPETLFTLESSKGYQIDNFEGIARHRGNHFFMVSDDNDFFLQRTLLLYFELLQE